MDYSQQTKSCQNMKSIASSKQNLLTTNKRITPDYSEMERNNIYAETPPKSKPNSSSIPSVTLVNGTHHYMPVLQQRRAPKNLIRNDLTQSVHDGTSTTSSMSSFSTATCSSQSTTPSTSFRQDSTSIMTRSADASSSGLIQPTSNTKSKSTFDIDTVTTDRSRQQVKENLNNNPNSKCSNTVVNGNFVPLQSVKEDECLEVDSERTTRCFQVRPTCPRGFSIKNFMQVEQKDGIRQFCTCGCLLEGDSDRQNLLII